MVKIKHIRANVEVSETHTQQVCVPEWELAILTAIHARREAGPEIVGVEYVTRDAAPDARSEYSRLEQRYGRTTQENGSKGAAWVAAVYGNVVAGNGALKRAIEAAVEEVQDEAPMNAEKGDGAPEGAGRQSLDDLGFGLLPDNAAQSGAAAQTQQVSSVGG